MNLIALLIALALERIATQLFHLRELRWLDPVFDRGIELIERFRSVPAVVVAGVVIAFVVLPVYLAWLSLHEALLGLPYVALSVGVLFFSLGPQDIGEEVDAWSAALAAGDEERSRQIAKALLERRYRDAGGEPTVEQAVCIQANNRMFGVIFWFVLLGPVGAWTFRVADLFRRRALFRTDRRREGEEDAVSSEAEEATEALHGLLAWLPARLTALSYALVGSFDAARQAWAPIRDELGDELSDEPDDERDDATGEGSASLLAGSERLLARVGCGALALAEVEGESETDRKIRWAGAAKRLVFRSLVFWVAAISALTLAGAAI